MTKWMDPKITLDWNSHEIDGLVRTLPMHHLESCGKPLKPPKKTIEGAKKLLNREKRFWQILRIHPFLFFGMNSIEPSPCHIRHHRSQMGLSTNGIWT